MSAPTDRILQGFAELLTSVLVYYGNEDCQTHSWVMPVFILKKKGEKSKLLSSEEPTLCVCLVPLNCLSDEHAKHLMPIV